MMTINEISKLIANDEHRTLELKKTTGELKDGMHSACAFLNTDGGWLIFGVASASLKILGQDVTETTRREIAQALAGLEPAIDVLVEYVDVPDRDGRQIIAMYFEPFVWGKIPYTYHGCPYYKVESTTIRMPRDMYDARLRVAKPKLHSWERQEADGIDLNDLNEERVRGAVRLGVEAGRISPSALTDDITRVLSKWHLLTNDREPNNAAAFLFGTNTNEYPQFKLRMARFTGNEKQEFLDSITAEGNYFDLLDAGTAFFFKHLFQSGKVVGFKREERLEIPAEALREALTNALCHRQWEKYNQTISIAIFDNRLEICNPGMLPPELPLELLKKRHESFPYNPVIAEVLFQTKFLERWGTGIQRIIDVCHEHNVPEPEWTYEQGIVKVTFKRVNDKVKILRCNIIDKKNDKDNQLSNDKDKHLSNNIINGKSDKAERVNYDQVKRLSNDKYMAILSYCMMPRNRREILKHIGLKCHTDNFKRYIKPLIDNGELTLTQPDKLNSPKQRYVTKYSVKRL
ncbi:MAG: putative DNA binding domain-containing protein [Prevotellaceae bacterium]|nr:putative DNA binding domain-containing protein [Prevotellaceae bacterium]